jgi:hypothetical protein
VLYYSLIEVLVVGPSWVRLKQDTFTAMTTKTCSKDNRLWQGPADSPLPRTTVKAVAYAC